MRKPMNFRLLFQAMTLFAVLTAIVGLCLGAGVKVAKAADTEPDSRIIEVMKYAISKGDVSADVNAVWVKIPNGPEKTLFLTVYFDSVATPLRLVFIEVKKLDNGNIEHLTVANSMRDNSFDGKVDNFTHDLMIFEDGKMTGMEQIKSDLKPQEKFNELLNQVILLSKSAAI